MSFPKPLFPAFSTWNPLGSGPIGFWKSVKGGAMTRFLTAACHLVEGTRCSRWIEVTPTLEPIRTNQSAIGCSRPIRTNQWAIAWCWSLCLVRSVCQPFSRVCGKLYALLLAKTALLSLLRFLLVPLGPQQVCCGWLAVCFAFLSALRYSAHPVVSALIRLPRETLHLWGLADMCINTCLLGLRVLIEELDPRIVMSPLFSAEQTTNSE